MCVVPLRYLLLKYVKLIHFIIIILQSLDGFVFALNQEGKFLYISETVSIYLGLSQVSRNFNGVHFTFMLIISKAIICCIAFVAFF